MAYSHFITLYRVADVTDHLLSNVDTVISAELLQLMLSGQAAAVTNFLKTCEAGRVDVPAAKLERIGQLLVTHDEEYTREALLHAVAAQAETTVELVCIVMQSKGWDEVCSNHLHQSDAPLLADAILSPIERVPAARHTADARLPHQPLQHRASAAVACARHRNVAPPFV